MGNVYCLMMFSFIFSLKSWFHWNISLDDVVTADTKLYKTIPNFISCKDISFMEQNFIVLLVSTQIRFLLLLRGFIWCLWVQFLYRIWEVQNSISSCTSLPLKCLKIKTKKNISKLVKQASNKPNNVDSIAQWAHEDMDR